MHGRRHGHTDMSAGAKALELGIRVSCQLQLLLDVLSHDFKVFILAQMQRQTCAGLPAGVAAMQSGIDGSHPLTFMPARH